MAKGQYLNLDITTYPTKETNSASARKQICGLPKMVRLPVLVMKSLMLLLHNCRNPKALTVLRAYYPCAFLLPGVMAGQMIIQLAPTEVLPFSIGTIICLTLLLLFRSNSYITNILTITIILGMVSALPSLIRDSKDISLQNEQSYVAEVYRRPRYSRTNQVTLSLRIIAKLNHTSQQVKIFPSATNVRCTTAHLPWKNSSKLDPNSLVVLKARFSPLLRETNPFSFSSSMRRQGYHATCRIKHLSAPNKRTPPLSYSIRKKLMQLVWNKAKDDQASGVLLAMTLGVRDLLTHSTETAYKQVGLAHLLVVSGYHITLVFYSLLLLPIILMARLPKLSSIIPTTLIATSFSLSITLGFVWLVGIEGSSLRAALALIFLAIAKSIERGGGMFNSICTSLLILLLFWPGCIFDVGIQLTFAALLGINIGLSYSVKGTLVKLLVICFFASLLTSLVTLCRFDHLSLIGFLLNPLLAPVIALIGCKLGLMTIILATFGLPFSAAPLKLLLIILTKTNDFITWISTLPGIALSPTGPFKIILILVLLCLIAHIIVKKLISLLLSHNVLARY